MPSTDADPFAQVALGSGEIKQRSIRSGAITFASQASSFFVNFISTVVLARLLTPADFGLVAMVLAVTAFAALLKDVGLSSATIQSAKLNHSQLSTMFWINVTLGVGLTVAVAAIAPALVWLYHEPQVLGLTMFMAPIFLMSSIGIQHGSLLKRQMRFAALAAATTISAVLGAASAISAAVAGFGYWSLAIGQLVLTATYSTIVWFLSGWTPSSPVRGAGVRSLVRYGANVTGFEIVNYFARNLDNVLIGRVWGSEALGLYSRAYSLLMLPISNLRGPLNAVGFPMLSRLRTAPEQYRAYYRKLASILAFISMPLAAFMFVTSDQLIRVVLGPQWIGASVIFQILALTAFIQPVAGLRGLVLMSSGFADRYFRWGMINAAVMIIAFLVGVKWGPTGVALGYSVANYAILHPSLKYAFRGTPVAPQDFYSVITTPAVASCAVAAAGLVVTRQMADAADYLVIVACLVAAIICYLGVTALLPGGRRTLRNNWSYLLVLLPRRTSATP